MSEGLLELDDHPGRRLLDGAKLTGVTADAWQAASTELTALWTVFEAYQTVIDRVIALRGSTKKLGDRELAALAGLLTGRSVALPRRAVPFERRGLLDPASTEHLLTLDEAVAEMARTYGVVKKTAVAAEDAWNSLLDPLDDLSSRIRAARAVVDQLELNGDPLLGRLQQIERETLEIRRLALSDPLGTIAGSGAGTPAKVSRLLSELIGVRADLDRAAAARTDFDAKIQAIQTMIDRVAGAEEEAERVRVSVLEKIAAPDIPRPSSAATHLRMKVAALQRERSLQSWTLLGRELAKLDGNCRVILENAQKRVALVRAPLDTREELRGLLEAYRARAARHGVSEAAALAVGYQGARDLLWSAPCDLAASEQAVRRYQAAVGEATPNGSNQLTF